MGRGGSHEKQISAPPYCFRVLRATVARRGTTGGTKVAALTNLVGLIGHAKRLKRNPALWRVGEKTKPLQNVKRVTAATGGFNFIKKDEANGGIRAPSREKGRGANWIRPGEPKEKNGLRIRVTCKG